MNTDQLADQLVVDEGIRLKPYRDSVGKLTIGVGRNLDDVGITHAEAMHLLRNDIAEVSSGLWETFSWWGKLDDARQQAIANMAFNLGVGGLKAFHQSLAFVEAQKWNEAAICLLQSHWAEQVGARAKRIAAIVRDGHA